MAKNGAMPQKSHPEIKENEEFLFNDDPGKDLMKEYNSGNIWESLRYGKTAWSSYGLIVSHLKPLFGIRKKNTMTLEDHGKITIDHPPEEKAR